VSGRHPERRLRFEHSTLAITTARLGAAEQHAAYGGKLASLSAASLNTFTTGYRWALVALGIYA
jgi:hypothetical protein